MYNTVKRMTSPLIYIKTQFRDNYFDDPTKNLFD